MKRLKNQTKTEDQNKKKLIVMEKRFSAYSDKNKIMKNRNTN